MLGEYRCPTPTEGGPPDVADAIAAAVRRAATDAGADPDQVTAVGVGAPGQIDIDEGTVTQARNLPDWDGSTPWAPSSAAAWAASRPGSATTQVAVRAEQELGAGRRFDSFIGVFCGTGVGGGVVLNRHLWLPRSRWRDRTPSSSRTAVPGPGVRVLEAYAGRAAMEEQARERIAAGEQSRLLAISGGQGQTADVLGRGPRPSARVIRWRSN